MESSDPGPRRSTRAIAVGAALGALTLLTAVAVARLPAPGAPSTVTAPLAATTSARAAPRAEGLVAEITPRGRLALHLWASEAPRALPGGIDRLERTGWAHTGSVTLVREDPDDPRGWPPCDPAACEPRFRFDYEAYLPPGATPGAYQVCFDTLGIVGPDFPPVVAPGTSGGPASPSASGKSASGKSASGSPGEACAGFDVS